MGVHTQRELEELLRDSLRTFCDKNFDFERELKISANVSFLADDEAAVECSFNETFQAQAGETQEPLRRKRGRPRKASLRTKGKTLVGEAEASDSPTAPPRRPIRRSRSKVLTENSSAIRTTELDNSDDVSVDTKTDTGTTVVAKTCPPDESVDIKAEPTESDNDCDIGLNDDMSDGQDHTRTNAAKVKALNKFISLQLISLHICWTQACGPY